MHAVGVGGGMVREQDTHTGILWVSGQVWSLQVTLGNSILLDLSVWEGEWEMRVRQAFLHDVSMKGIFVWWCVNEKKHC